MQLFSYNQHPFLFIAFPFFFLLNEMLYLLFLACSCFQHVLQLSQHVYLLFSMIYHFDVVGLAFLGQDMSKFHVCAQIHMILGSFPCLCLDLHAYVFFTMFLLRSACLCLNLHVYAQIYVFMCSVPCLCAQIYVGCYAMCYFSTFCPLISLFPAFQPFR